MNKLISNNTDLLVIIFAIACIALTFAHIMDVKDFNALALMVFGYKFAKWQMNQNKPKEDETPNLG